MGERANRLEARWSESHAQYPGRPRPTPVTGDVRLSSRPRTERGVSRGHSSGAHRREGPNLRSRTGPMRSRREGDAGTRAGRPEPVREVGGGTAEVSEQERQARAAHNGEAGDGARNLIDEVLRRENMQTAHARVVSNGGAPGVDGMTVEALAEHGRGHWPRVRQELLGGTYEPQPVRRVEIPKPGEPRRTDATRGAASEGQASAPARAARCHRCCPTSCSTSWTRNWSDGGTASCAMPTTATCTCDRRRRASG